MVWRGELRLRLGLRLREQGEGDGRWGTGGDGIHGLNMEGLMADVVFEVHNEGGDVALCEIDGQCMDHSDNQRAKQWRIDERRTISRSKTTTTTDCKQSGNPMMMETP